MPETSLINASLNLMAIGMGTVFSFLLLLVAMLRAMSWLAQRLSGEPAELPMAAGTAPSATVEAEQQRLIAAISAAITYYRSRRRP
jgi:oxaloacetate decarboxylase gamma subunit